MTLRLESPPARATTDTAAFATLQGMPPPEAKPEQDPWLGVEVRHLAALRAVADEGSFGAAALRLGYAQSAISQQVAALERLIGHRLFDRPGGPRPVRLTRAGELLLEHSESILTRLSAARADLESLELEDVATPLRVGAYQTVAPALLPLVLRELDAQPGEAPFALVESYDDGELLALLEKGDLDVAFTECPDVEPPLECEPLFDDPYVLLVGSSHPLADEGPPIALEEVAAVPLVLLAHGTGQERLLDAFRLHGLSPRIVQRVQDPRTLLALVAGGTGAGLVPRLVGAALGAEVDTTVTVRPVEDRLPPRRVGVAWHRDRLRTCTAGMFVDLLVELAPAVAEPALS